MALTENQRLRREDAKLAYAAFIPNPENKPEVNHDDGNKFNCHVSNLFWATRAENMQHAVKNGLAKSGVESYQAKLTREQVVYIRDNPDNLSSKELAEKFRIKQGTVREIQRGKTYQNAGGTIRESKFKCVSEETKQQILADWATGQYTKADLARKFGYHHSTISNIVREGQ